MSGILVRKADTGEESVLEAKGLFYGIGHSPNSQLLKGQVELDSSGYVLVQDGTAKLLWKVYLQLEMCRYFPLESAFLIIAIAYARAGSLRLLFASELSP